MIHSIYVILLLGLAALLLLVLIIVLPLARRGTPSRGQGHTTPKPEGEPGGEPGEAARHHGRHPARPAGQARSHARARGAAGHHRGVPRSHAVRDGAGEAKPAAKGRDTGAAIAIVTALGGAFGVISWLEGAWDSPDPPTPVEITAGPLHGTLLARDPSDPLVLIIPGSGPTDRNGNSPMGISAGSLRLLAEGLIGEDIASLRIDKRGLFASQAAGDPSAVSPAIYAGDIHAWIDSVAAERGSDAGCVFLAGHSEGALMASIAAQERSDVCGVILIAGMGRPMGDVIRSQLAANPATAPLMGEAFSALEALEAGRRVDTTGLSPPLLALFSPTSQDYLISALRVDPVEELRKAGKPALVIQGDNDLQVSLEDANRLAATPGTELAIISGMNHVLKDAPPDRAGNLATYADPSLPLSEELIDRIDRFVREND